MKKTRLYISLLALAMSSFLISCDDEASAPSKVTFAGEEFIVGESDGAITLGFQLDKPALTDVTIGITGTGTATEGEDYEFPETAIVIPKGETNGSVELEILKDVAFEGDETINISFSSAGGISSTGTYEVTITDNDCDFEWVGDLGGYDVNLDLEDTKYDAAVTIVQDGESYTIDGLNVGFIEDWWGETVIESVPVTFTVDSDGNITIDQQYIFTTLYNGVEYPYDIKGTGKLNTCEGNITLDYDVIQDGFEVGDYCHTTGKWMTDPIFKAVLEPLL